MTINVKFDYNILISQIDDVISKSRSKAAKEYGFLIAVGINLLNEYMRNIALRAIQINDDVLIGLLMDMSVITKEEGDGDGKEESNSGGV